MSKFIPVEGLSKRPKRASRACDHCRWKRLKCSDEKKDQSCMNCIIYGTKCQYTPPWSPSSGRKKDPTSKSGAATSSKKRSTNSAAGDRASQSPGAFDSQDSPSSSLHDDAFLPSSSQALMPKMANARRLAVEFLKNSNPSLDMDQVGHRLDQYATFLTNFSDSQKSPVEILSDDTGLPPQPIANALLQAYVDGLQAGTMTTNNRLRPQMASNNRRSRSLHEFTNSHGDVSMAESIALGPLVTQAAGLGMSAAQAAHPPSPLGYGMDLSGAGGLGGEFSLPIQGHQQLGDNTNAASVPVATGAVHHHPQHASATSQHHAHHHHRAVQSRAMPNGMPTQAPRSIPQGLGLAIAPDQQHQWGSGPNSAPPMMPPGYGSNPFDML